MASRFFDIASAVNAVAKHDDSAAFEYLFNTHYDRLYRIGFYYMESDNLAEDAVSEVFYKVWLHRKRLPSVENFESYLFSMTKNYCLSRIRADKKIDFNDDMVDYRQQISVSNPETLLISAEFLAFVDKHISELPPRCKIIFLMVKEEGMKYKDVAEILNISVKTVENQMTKAIGYIRKIVNSYQADLASKQQTE